MKASKHDGLTLSHLLANFLISYRSTAHATMQRTPCSLFLGQSIRALFDMLKPDLQEHVAAKQAVQKDQHDQHAHERNVTVGDPVMVKKKYVAR